MDSQEKNKKRSFLLRWMFILNIIAVLFLLLSYGASFISPEKIWWLALFGLGYGILLSIHALFIIFWLLLKNKKFLLSFCAVIIGGSKILNIAEIHFFETAPTIKNASAFPLKVMSFNVRLFDLYNWMHNTETREKIFQFLAQESPDIVCFQEYYTSESRENNFNYNDTLKEILHAPYSDVEYTVTMQKLNHWGIATFSRFPIVNRHAVRFQKKDGNIFIFSDIAIGTDTIRVYNTHLESIRFRMQDYKFIENLGTDVEQDEVKGSLGIISRLKRAFIKRELQVDILHRHISESPYPAILCGDFNDTPSSYTYSTLSKGLDDAFRESGSGLGKTYAGAFPSFRIDYILYDPRLHSSGYRTIHEKLSDHYPISCFIEKKQQ